jgi:hypothetical protein
VVPKLLLRNPQPFNVRPCIRFLIFQPTNKAMENGK